MDKDLLSRSRQQRDNQPDDRRPTLFISKFQERLKGRNTRVSHS